MAPIAQFADVFAALKSVLKKHEKALRVLKNEESASTLATKPNSNRGIPMWRCREGGLLQQ